MNIFSLRKIYLFVRAILLKSLYRLSYSIKKNVEEELLFDFLNRLEPKKINRKLVRIGSKGDGGYFIPEDFFGISSCFSAGIGSDANFEYDLAQKNIKIFMADYSIDSPPLSHNNFFFIKKFISNNNSNNINFDDWFKKNYDNKKDHILKLDIEGDEYDVLSSISEKHLLKMRIIIFEIHNFSSILNPLAFKFIKFIFDKLQKNHSIIYVNNNPISPIINFSEKIKIHDQIEITMIRNDRLN